MDLESLRFFYLRRIVGTAFKSTSVERGDQFARQIARMIYALGGAGRRQAEARAADWLDDAGCEGDAERLVQAMYEHCGRFWAESLFISRLLRETSWRRFVDIREAQWRAIARTGRGCLIATALYGHPGVLACALGRIFRPLHVIADRLRGSAAAELQNELYRAPCVEPLDREAATKEIPGLLERGTAVMMIAETERASGRACDISFLGRRLRAYPTLARLARSFNVPIIPAICRRGARPFRFEIAAGEINEPDGTREEVEVMADILWGLERMISEAPAQYLWNTPVLADGGAIRLSESDSVVQKGSEYSRLSA